jgi:hypothetical protein
MVVQLFLFPLMTMRCGLNCVRSTAEGGAGGGGGGETGPLDENRAAQFYSCPLNSAENVEACKGRSGCKGKGLLVYGCPYEHD